MKILDDLNEEQRIAVVHKNGPLLILAGAGSGKTRVLTRRIAYLIEEYGVSPWNILALTFTNKAAKEMKERVLTLVGNGGENIWVSTFHSACVKILRRFIDKIGYDRQFNIYDTDDTKTVMKGVLKSLNIDSKKFSEKSFLAVISDAKNKFIEPENFAVKSGFEWGSDLNARVYAEYERRMRSNNALDFDDLLVKTVKLFEEDREVLEYYRRRFRYILVDEYQDTNYVQFRLLRLLANYENEAGEIENNILAVGDDDQSIYKFRGADIRNILNFEKVYPDCTVVKLEENYRSTGNILEAANGVIQNNRERKRKRLWTQKESGASVSYKCYENGDMESEGIAGLIGKTVRENKAKYSEIAVLYRTNAQSRSIEEKLLFKNIPYKIYGGTNFYSRREIKDILAYLKAINNPKDDVQIRRILNVPKRGIGTATEDKIAEYAAENEISFFDAAARVNFIPGLGRAAAKVEKFVAYIEGKRNEFLDTRSLKNAVEELIDEIGYIEDLKAEHTDEAEGRIDNIYELINKIAVFETEAEDRNSLLESFLFEVSLVSDIESQAEDTDKVTLMTLHSAKGLEFKIVFICGMEENLFPSYMSINSGDDGEIEEERRLCYVGITRAMEKLYLTGASMRMLRGNVSWNRPSRFINEIPAHLLSEGVDRIRTRKEKNESLYAEFTGSKHTGKDNLFFNNPFISKGFAQSGNQSEKVSEGDRVRHSKFGDGELVAVSADGEIYTVRFDDEAVGIRKMKAEFAGLKKM